MGGSGKGKTKAFYFNDDMEEFFEEMRKDNECASNAETLKLIFAECRKQKLECGQVVQMEEKRETIGHLGVTDMMEDFVDEVKKMDKKTAYQYLVELSHKSKKEVKAANDSGMYGPNSWGHFLEDAAKFAAPPSEVADEAVRHFMCMILASRMRGENPDYLRLELRNLHLSRGRSYSKQGDSMKMIRYGQDRPWGTKQDSEKVLH